MAQSSHPNACSYDKDAPTKVGAKHTPSLVLILCAAFVRGLTQAASLVSRVIKPYRCKIDQKMDVIWEAHTETNLVVWFQKSSFSG